MKKMCDIPVIFRFTTKLDDYSGFKRQYCEVDANGKVIEKFGRNFLLISFSRGVGKGRDKVFMIYDHDGKLLCN